MLPASKVRPCPSSISRLKRMRYTEVSTCLALAWQPIILGLHREIRIGAVTNIAHSDGPLAWRARPMIHTARQEVSAQYR
jgi:hypothetical protein